MYSRTKAAIDALVRANNTPSAADNNSRNFENQLLTTVLRVTGLYGPRDRLTMVEKLRLVNTPKTWFQIGSNTLVHDMVHVENGARAHILAVKALLSPHGERADGEAFSISDGKPMRFWDFAHKMWEYAGDANWAPQGPHRVIVIPFWVVLSVVGALEWVFWVFTFGMIRPYSNLMTYELYEDWVLV